MKQSANVTVSRRKNRKAHFSAPSHLRRKIMSSSLSKELQKEHSVRSLPIRVDDEILIVRGAHKGREGKVITCYRRKFVIHVEKITREKVNGSSIPVPIDASKVVITKIKMDKDRKNLLARKAAGRALGKVVA